jgi:hypothetical protein
MRRPETKLRRRGKDLANEEIRDMARKHFAEDFPNPERRGCPPTSDIKLLAYKPLKGKDSVLDHVGFCSPCYRNFAYFLQVRRKKFRTTSGRNL